MDILYGYPFDSTKFSSDSHYPPLIRIRDVKPGRSVTFYSASYPDEYIIKKDDMLVGMDGEFNMGRWKDARFGLLNQRVCKISSKDSEQASDNYLFHLLRPMFKNIEAEIKGGTVKHLSAKRINKIKIPLPPIAEQRRIAAILDKFEALTNSLQDGLPAEIAARRQQYEYYRDKLLTFPRKTA